MLNRIPPQWRKRLLWVALGCVLYSLVGFLLVPAIIKWQLLKRLPDLTKRQASIAQVRFNPWALSLTIRGLTLREPDGRAFASWDELYVNFQLSSLFRWAWTFDTIRLTKPAGEVILFPDGHLNLANLFPPATNPPPAEPASASVPHVLVFDLQITNGFFAFEDRTRRQPFRSEYQPINLRLTRLTTQPGTETPYSFHAESDTGRRFAWAGSLEVQPPASSGTIEIDGIQLPHYQPYLDDFTHAQLVEGTADFHADYRFRAATNGVDLVVSNVGLAVAQLTLKDPKTGESVFTLPGLAVTGGAFDLRARTARVEQITVSAPTLLARLEPSHTLNLLDLLVARTNATTAAPAKTTADTNSEPPIAATVDDFKLDRAAVTFEDRSRPGGFRTVLDPISLQLQHFTTRTNADAAFDFQVATEAKETVSAKGTLSINPIRSAGQVRLDAIAAGKYQPYLADFFRGQISNGKLDVTVPYHVALAANGLSAGVTNLEVKLGNLAIKLPPADETVAGLRELSVGGVDASLEDRQVRVGSVQVSGVTALIRRHKDGAINLLGLLPPASASTNPPPTRPTTAGPTWNVAVDRVGVADSAFEIEDQVPPTPVVFKVDQFALNLEGLSTAGGQPVKAELGLRLNESAHLGVSGTAEISPLAADLDLGLTNLDLRVFQPYVAERARLRLDRGALGTSGKVHFAAGTNSAPQVTFAGALSLTNLATRLPDATNDLVRWDDLELKGIDFALAPPHVKLEEIAWRGLAAQAALDAQGQLNFSKILLPLTNAPAPPTPPSAPAPNAEAPPIEVGALVLDNATLGFTDHSIQPPATAAITALSGRVEGLSSAMNTTANVDLHGLLGAQAPFAVTGRINPLARERFVDLTFTNANAQLTPFTPYMEKYAGHPLNKGRLNLALHYQVQGMKLDAQNHVQIDQLMLGPRNNSPDATSLPVKLGVALLKDSSGRITLDVPVSGRLDDPSFRVAPVVLKVVVNLIAKAAVSPFKLLGALVGGGEELSFVEFAPGTATAAESETAKLTKLAKALAERPALNLEIDGAVDPVRDREALARARLRSQIEARLAQAQANSRKPPPDDPNGELARAGYQRVLRDVFIEHFGTNLTELLRTNALVLAATNQAPAAVAKPKKGVFRWIAGLFGGGPKKSPVEKHLSKAERATLDQLTPEVMETLLLPGVPVSAEDLRQLMTARAQWVQDWLLTNGQVAADRLFLVAPKPVDAKYHGESRVTLSLN